MKKALLWAVVGWGVAMLFPPQALVGWVKGR